MAVLSEDSSSWNLASLNLPLSASPREESVETLETPLEVHARGEAAAGGVPEFTAAPRPVNDGDRVRHQRSFNIMDTPYEEQYDRVMLLISQTMSMRIALIDIIDDDRGWFKSIVGWPGVTEVPRDNTLCAYMMLPAEPEVLVSQNMAEDARFVANPFVLEPASLRSYLGVPLVSANGHRIGSVCAIDFTPRNFTREDCTFVTNLAELVMREIESQYSLSHGGELRSSAAFEGATLLVHQDVSTNRWEIKYGTSVCDAILGHSPADLAGRDLWDVMQLKASLAGGAQLSSGGGEGVLLRAFEASIEAREEFGFLADVLSEDGRKHRVSVSARVATVPLDDMAGVQTPVDSLSEDSLLSYFWFLTVRQASVASAHSSSSSLVSRIMDELRESAQEPFERLGSASVFIERDEARSDSPWLIAFANEEAARALGCSTAELARSSVWAALQSARLCTTVSHGSLKRRVRSEGGAREPAEGPAPSPDVLACLVEGADFEFMATLLSSTGRPETVLVRAACCSLPQLGQGDESAEANSLEPPSVDIIGAAARSFASQFAFSTALGVGAGVGTARQRDGDDALRDASPIDAAAQSPPPVRRATADGAAEVGAARGPAPPSRQRSSTWCLNLVLHSAHNAPDAASRPSSAASGALTPRNRSPMASNSDPPAPQRPSQPAAPTSAAATREWHPRSRSLEPLVMIAAPASRTGRLLSRHLHGSVFTALEQGDDGCHRTLEWVVEVPSTDSQPRRSTCMYTSIDRPCLGNMRALMHGNLFKKLIMPDTPGEAPTFLLNFPRACAFAESLALELAAVHARGTAHGEVTDLTVLALCPEVPGGWERALLLPPSPEGAQASLVRVAAVREDYTLFFAPERCPESAAAPLGPCTLAADVWSLGALLLLLVKSSLPLVGTCAWDVAQLRTGGVTPDQVLGLDDVRPHVPEGYVDIMLQCLSPVPSQRPAAPAVARALNDLTTSGMACNASTAQQ